MFSPLPLNAQNPGPMTGAGNNTYLIAADHGEAALIDAGVGDPRHLTLLGHALEKRRARLTAVLVTHAHADHAAGAPALAAAYRDASFFKQPWPGEDERYPIPWRTLGDGDVVMAGGEPLVALHTPGHSPDHLAFWHAGTRTAFTGDLVVAGSSVMIQTSRGGSLAEYMRSLERILALDPRQLLPAHGPRVDDPHALLVAYLDHRRAREQQVIDALTAGHGTVEAIAESIYHGLDPALMPAARENVRAHLEKLKADGRAAAEAGRWHLDTGQRADL